MCLAYYVTVWCMISRSVRNVNALIRYISQALPHLSHIKKHITGPKCLPNNVIPSIITGHISRYMITFYNRCIRFRVYQCINHQETALLNQSPCVPLRVAGVRPAPVFTVYPKKYAHGFCFAVLCCGYTLTDLPISIRLTLLALWQSNDCPSCSKATLMNMDKYFMWIHYERLHNHNKAKHNKTVCIFLGIYCMQAKVLYPVQSQVRSVT